MKYGWRSSSESSKCVKCGKKTSEYRTVTHGSIQISIAVCPRCDYMIYPSRIVAKTFKQIKEDITMEY